jgi:hypothetical protein
MAAVPAGTLPGEIYRPGSAGPFGSAWNPYTPEGRIGQALWGSPPPPPGDPINAELAKHPEAVRFLAAVAPGVNLLQPVSTLMDPNASAGEKVVAGVQTAINVAPAVAALAKGVAALQGAVAVGEAAEGLGAAGPAARFIVAPSGATIETGLSAAELLVPNGARIGEAGASGSIRLIQGGATEAGMLFEQLSAGGTGVVGSYPGTLVNLGSGGTVGLRTVATGTGARLVPVVTIDVNIPGIVIRELKFIP